MRDGNRFSYRTFTTSLVISAQILQHEQLLDMTGAVKSGLMMMMMMIMHKRVFHSPRTDMSDNTASGPDRTPDESDPYRFLSVLSENDAHGFDPAKA